MTNPYRGMGHRDHPWLNELVCDTQRGLVGRLMAVCPESVGAASRPFRPMPVEEPAVAWLRPAEGGGREWTTPLNSITRAGNSTSPRPG